MDLSWQPQRPWLSLESHWHQHQRHHAAQLRLAEWRLPHPFRLLPCTGEQSSSNTSHQSSLAGRDHSASSACVHARCRLQHTCIAACTSTCPCWTSGKRICGHQGGGDAPSTQDTSECRTVPRPMMDSLRGSQSRPITAQSTANGNQRITERMQQRQDAQVACAWHPAMKGEGGPTGKGW